MNLWEAIKKGGEEGLEALKDSLSVLMAETGKTSRILKRRVELTSVQGSVRRTFAQLGSLAYDLYSRGEQDLYANEEFKSLIARVEGYKTRVREIEEEIETIKREERQKMQKEKEDSEQQPPANPPV